MKKLIDLINAALEEKNGSKVIKEFKQKQKKVPDEYERYNRDLLSYMKTKADLINQLKSELSPLLEKAIEIFVNYLIIDDTEEEVDDSYFYKEPKVEEDNVIIDDKYKYCPFKLTSKSLEEINKSFEVGLRFVINEKSNLSTLDIDNDYDEVTYIINDYINCSMFVYNDLADNNSADLILVGEFENSQHKLKIYTRKYIKDDYIGNLISAIFLDSDLYIVNSVEKIKQNNNCCCNNELTEKELNAVESIKKAAEDNKNNKKINKMLNLNYKLLDFSKVSDYDSFYKESLPEILKIKSIIENCKILFSMPQSRVILEVAEGERVYKISLLTSGANKSVFGTLIYLPLEKRLDLFGYNLEYPLIQWKNKKVSYTSYETIFDLAKIDKCFDNIINVI